MHLIVAFAAPPPAGGPAVPSGLAAPALERLLADWVEVQRDAGDASTLSPPHERAWAAAFGWPAGADGCLPWAARQAALDGVAVGTQAWTLLTPAHCRVGSDGVHLADPEALALSETDSRTLLEALRPLLEREGYGLAWGAALRWYAAHPSLQGLASASLDRVVGRTIDAWQPRQPEAGPLRRLQNEAQMLLHAHPLNEAREATGALAVNSFWFSGCGAALPVPAGAARLELSLRGPTLAGDTRAWCDAWRALDAQAIAPLLAAAARGEPVRLTLCGERQAATFAPRRRAWWQRLARAVSASRVDARTLLESL